MTLMAVGSRGSNRIIIIIIISMVNKFSVLVSGLPKLAPRLDLTSRISSIGIARLDSSVGGQAILFPIYKNNLENNSNFRCKKNKLPSLSYFLRKTLFKHGTRVIL